MSLNTYCSYCGQKFAEQKIYPRKCFFCGNDTYRNPIPVAVGIIPVVNQNEIGILILKRGNEPGKGEWAMPGGFLEYGESWEQGLSREIKEELGLVLEPNYSLKGIELSTGKNLIIFGMSKTLVEIPPFTSNEEALEIGLYTKLEDELAFPSHTTYARSVLKSLTHLESGVCA